MDQIAGTLRELTEERVMANACDVIIVGGGLAGLTLAIQSARAGYKVVLFEKEKYPFHKVCGEYISFESWDFLEEMGVPLSEMNLPVIRKLQISAPNGKTLQQMLPLGGFGLSRYKLDAILADICRHAGVTLFENARVDDIQFQDQYFIVRSASSSIRSHVCAGTFGKRSNLDVKWKRAFTKKTGKLNNFVGVKYHVRYHHDPSLISLHNFRNGYCGISKVEEDRSCLCYMTNAANLQSSGNSIKRMEENILGNNPLLKKIFTEAKFLSEEPVTISQISFSEKSQVHEHVLLTGDAAGMIAPLCGNGMSMALYGSKILFSEIDRFLQQKQGRQQMEANYEQRWRREFGRRLSTGRVIQKFFGSPVLSNVLVSGLRPFPGLVNRLISATHGQPF